MVAEVARLVGDGAPGGVDFEALERACRDAALGIRGRMVANRLNADPGRHKGVRGLPLRRGCVVCRPPGEDLHDGVGFDDA